MLPGLAGLSLALIIGACAMPSFMSFPSQQRGNRVDPDQLSQLVVGTSTRTDATALLGTPTAKATFDDDTWLYLAEVTRPVIAGTNDIEHQQVVILHFDNGGVLRQIEHKTQADAEPVQIVSRTTPSPGSEASWLQQLLGNVGKFSAGSPGGGGTGGGAPGGGGGY